MLTEGWIFKQEHDTEGLVGRRCHRSFQGDAVTTQGALLARLETLASAL